MKLEDATFLIGDDSILARKQLKDIISSFGGLNFIEASDGQEVIDLYKKHTPELVFLDLVMPVKDGITVIKEILKFQSQAEIIIVSSMGTQSQLRTSIELGAKDFLQKPVDRTHIQKILQARFEGR